MPDPQYSDAVVMVRMAALSVAEGENLLTRGQAAAADDLVAAGIAIAAGGGLLTAAAEGERAAAAVRRYVARMSSRATPFGLFAGTCVVPVDKQTHLVSLGREQYTAKASLDVAALEKVIPEAAKECGDERVPLQVNSTLRLVDGVLRYRLPGNATSDIVEIRATPPICAAVKACRPAPMSRAEIVTALLAAYPAASPEDLRAFVNHLASRGLLLAHPAPLAAGVDPAEVTAAFLTQCGLAEQAGTVLAVHATVSRPSAITGGYVRALDDAWQQLAGQLPVVREIPAQHRYAVELKVRVAGTVGRPLLKQLTSAVTRLQEVIPPADPTEDFRLRFQERYGDASVSLLEAADPEGGVLARAKRAFSPLTAPIVLPEEAESNRSVSSIQAAALDHWLRTGRSYDLGSPQTEQRALPGITIQAALVAGEHGAVTAQLLGFSSRSPAALLARFAASEPELASQLRDQIRQASVARTGRADVISAEVLYTPGGRIGNVLVRPVLCDETLALTGATGGTLALDRLMLRIEEGQLAVHDSVSGRPVVLYLNSAHATAPDHLDPLYVLLANLCHRALKPWNWGGLETLSHLPRVRCGEVIVSPETWRLDAAAVRAVTRGGDPVSALREQLPGLGDRRWLGFGLSDQKLAVDTSRAESIVEVLGRQIRTKTVQLVELPHVEHPAVSSPTGRHVAEIVAAFAGRSQRRAASAPHCPPQERPNWVYFQYFCGPSSAEPVITRVAGLVQRLRAEKRADLWFFMRYGEGGYHVRARIRAATAAARNDVLAAMEQLGATMRAERIVTSYRAEPYVPEIRRYGGKAGIVRAEELFSADSDDVAARIDRDPSEADRLIAAGHDLHAWWSVLGEPSVEALRRAQQSMLLGRTVNRKAVGKVIREHRAAFDTHDAPDPDGAVSEGLRQLVTAVSDSWGAQFLPGLLGSVAHMHCNRLFAFDQRRMEYLAYEFAIQQVLRTRARPPALALFKG